MILHRSATCFPDENDAFKQQPGNHHAATKLFVVCWLCQLVDALGALVGRLASAPMSELLHRATLCNESLASNLRGSLVCWLVGDLVHWVVGKSVGPKQI